MNKFFLITASALAFTSSAVAQTATPGVVRDDATKTITLNVNEMMSGTDAGVDASLFTPDMDEATRKEIEKLLLIGKISLNTRTKVPQSLADSIRQICLAARMHYVIPNLEDFKDTVSVAVTDNPYKILRLLANIYGYEMRFNAEGSCWNFYKPRIGELVTRAYTIKYNDLSTSEITAGTAGGNINLQGNSGGGGGGGGDSSGGSTAIGTVVITQTLKERLDAILKLPTTSLFAPIEALDMDGNVRRNLALEYSPAVTAVNVTGSMEWFPETRTFVVRGTRMQHDLIAKLVKEFDKPSSQIQIACQFLSVLGADNIQKGIDFTNAAKPVVTFSPDVGAIGAGASGISSAVLSVSSLSAQLNFLRSRAGGVVKDNPVVVSRDGQIFTFKNTNKEPILAGSAQVSGGTATSTSNITYMEIGTVLTVIPRVRAPDPVIGPDPLIYLECTVSSTNKTGTKQINGQEYPLVAVKEYACKVTVPNGYTLAISGIRSEQEASNDVGLWPLSEIPWLGEKLFTYTSNSKQDGATYAYLTTNILTLDSLDSEVSTDIIPRAGMADRILHDRMDWRGNLVRDAAVSNDEEEFADEEVEFSGEATKVKPTKEAPATPPVDSLPPIPVATRKVQDVTYEGETRKIGYSTSVEQGIIYRVKPSPSKVLTPVPLPTPTPVEVVNEPEVVTDPAPAAPKQSNSDL